MGKGGETAAAAPPELLHRGRKRGRGSAHTLGSESWSPQLQRTHSCSPGQPLGGLLQQPQENQTGFPQGRAVSQLLGGAEAGSSSPRASRAGGLTFAAVGPHPSSVAATASCQDKTREAR